MPSSCDARSRARLGAQKGCRCERPRAQADEDVEGRPLPSMRNHLDRSSVAQRLDGPPSDGEPAIPRTTTLFVNDCERKDGVIAPMRPPTDRGTRVDIRRTRRAFGRPGPEQIARAAARQDAACDRCAEAIDLWSGDRRLPVRRMAVQALRNARLVEVIAHGRNPAFHHT